MDDLDLFSIAMTENTDSGVYVPLAERMRPKDFSQYVGQEKIFGEGKFLRRMIESDKILSMILYGPPGTGKTTLAKMIANLTKSDFQRLNAVASGIAEVRKIIKEAEDLRKIYNRRTIVFIDEIHRFNKAQQDVLLPYVEEGAIVLIGATTENPYFEVNHALLSRVKVVKLEALKEQDILKILRRGLTSPQGLNAPEIRVEDEVLLQIANMAGGDARISLNLLEQAYESMQSGSKQLELSNLEELMAEKVQRYDKKGDNHYDIVSAFIKSMRGSDPDAALHYLARMLAAGEDINFIARRIAICASEDVGNADPQALVLAMATVQAVQFLGMPEARIPLAQAVTYIACAPKSNASYLAIDKALADVRTKNCGEVPSHLRDAHYKGAAKLGHGVDYKYAHDYPNHYVKQQYLPDKMRDVKYYEPTDNGYDKNIKAYLAKCRAEDE